MNLCFITTFPPTQCGIATYSNYLIKSLINLNPNIKIFVICESNIDQSLIENYLNVKVFPCFNRESDYYEQILDLLKDLDLDIVHIQHEYGIFGKDFRFLKLLKGIKDLGLKLIVTLHTLHTKDCFSSTDWESYEKEISTFCDFLVVHLEFCMGKVMERIGVDPKKIVVIPHGTYEVSKIDKLLARKKLGLPEKGKILLSFGFVRKLKDELTVIDSLYLIKKEVPDVYLFIAGNPQPNREEDLEYLNLCKQRVKELNLEKEVIFSDRFIRDKDLPYVFSASDVCIFAYRDEVRSASGSFHLAVGAGKPVILSRIPKFEEEGILNISDEIMAIPQTPESFAKIAIRFFTDKPFYEYVKTKIKEFGLKTSWENIAQKHLDLYKVFF